MPVPLDFKKLIQQEPSIDEANRIYDEKRMNELNNLQLEDMQQGIPQIRPQQQNPFLTEQYRNVNVPDSPIQYGGGIADSLLNNEEVPEEIRERWWNIFHKDNVLTFLDDTRKESKMLNFDIQKIDFLNTLPYYAYTFEKELEIDIMRNVYETKLDRALGLKGGNVKNERIILQSQFSEQRMIQEDGMGGNMIREGFFKRLLKRRG